MSQAPNNPLGGGDNLGEAWVKIRADTGEFTASVDAARAKTEEFATKGAKPAEEATGKFASATERANRETRFLGVNVGGTVRQFRALRGAVMGAVAALGALAAVIYKVYTLGNQWSKTMLGITDLTKKTAAETERLSKQFDKIVEIQQQRVAEFAPSNLSPTAFQDSVDNLEAYQAELEKTKKSLQEIGGSDFRVPYFTNLRIQDLQSRIPILEALIKQTNDAIARMLLDTRAAEARQRAAEMEAKTRGGDITSDVSRLRQAVDMLLQRGGVR